MHGEHLNIHVSADMNQRAHQRLTLPSRQKESHNNAANTGGLLSRAYAHAQPPRLALSAGSWEPRTTEQKLWDRPTVRLKGVALQRQWRGPLMAAQAFPGAAIAGTDQVTHQPHFFASGKPPGAKRAHAPRDEDILNKGMQFLGYTSGTVGVVTLYIVIPLMVLESFILPSQWQQLLVALGVLGLAEVAICTILLKTTPQDMGSGAASRACEERSWHMGHKALGLPSRNPPYFVARQRTVSCGT